MSVDPVRKHTCLQPEIPDSVDYCAYIRYIPQYFSTLANALFSRYRDKMGQTLHTEY